MKRLLSELMLMFTSFAFIYAQAPQMFNYQAVVRDASGNVIANTQVDINILIRDGSPVGTVVFDETHVVTTNEFGLVNLQIGSIETVQFSGIDWSGDVKFIEIVVNGTSVGTQQLLSVPYSLHSQTSEDAFSGNYSDLAGVPTDVSTFNNDAGYITSPDDADADPANEIQSLSISGNDLTISGANTVTIPQNVYTAGNGIDVTGNVITNTLPDQAIVITGSGATTVTGTYPSFTISSTDNVDDADADPTNELQVLSVSNDTLFLSNGGYVSLSGYSDTLWRIAGNDIHNTNSGKVGIGTTTPPGKLVVQGDASMADTVPLFEVKDRTGATVFIVYPDSARFYVCDDGSKTNKGAFAVSGRNTVKQLTNNFLLVTPDSSRIWTGDTITGFGVRNIGAISKTSYMQLTPNNYFIGHESGLNITSGRFNNFFGYQAGYSDTSGGYNVANGYQALYSNTSGIRNTAEGYQALYSNTTGSYNTASGFGALYSNTFRDNNTAYGYKALYSSTSGEFNTACGTDALRFNTTGRYNTALGYSAFRSGIYDNSMALGNDAIVNASNKVVVGNSSISSAWIQVDWTIGSDSRIKKNIQEDIPGIEFIKLLRPVSYNYDISKENSLLGIIDTAKWEGKNDIERIRFSGFIAQEVDSAAKEIGYDYSGVDKSGTLWGLRYSEFTVPLVKAVQELNEKNLELQSDIEKLQMEVELLKEEIKNIKAAH